MARRCDLCRRGLVPRACNVEVCGIPAWNDSLGLRFVVSLPAIRSSPSGFAGLGISRPISNCRLGRQYRGNSHLVVERLWTDGPRNLLGDQPACEHGALFLQIEAPVSE